MGKTIKSFPIVLDPEPWDDPWPAFTETAVPENQDLDEVAGDYIFKRHDEKIKALKWSRLNWLMIGVMFGAVFATIIFHTILFIPPEYTWGGLLP